jgi:DNA-binding LacI/PurR family transcriptional regulator/signal transduction histidine kinase
MSPLLGGHRRTTVGFMVESLFDGFQERLWQSVAAAAQALDVNLFCMLGGFLWYGQKGRTVYDLISPERFDGIISLTGALGCGIEKDDLRRYLRRFEPLPVVSVSQPIPGLSSVLVDNRSGMRQLVSHLVEAHGRRRIAFVQGPSFNAEAVDRYQAYCDALQAHGLACDPQLVCPGDFERTAGIRAVQTLLDERKADFDALVGANDYMAIYAMAELQRRGVRVPEDVAVAGFDDIRDASGTVPSLTTVRQPLREMGDHALRTLLRLIQGEAQPEQTVFSSSVARRRSCGCMPSLEPATAGLADPNVALAPAELVGRLQALFPEQVPPPSRAAWAQELASAVLRELENASPEPFLGVLERLILGGYSLDVTATAWHPVIATLFRALRPRCPQQETERLQALWESSLVLVSSVAEQAQIARHVRAKEELRILPRIFEMTHLDEEELKQRIRSDLPAFGIRAFFLSRYVETTREEATLFVHYDLSGRVALDPSLKAFPARWLIPGQIGETERFSYAVLPVDSKPNQLGFAVCDMGTSSGAAYDFLIRQITEGLQIVALMEDVRRYATDLEVQVEERTRQLRDAERNLVNAAHQAGMADVAISIMHGAGNLLNSVHVSAEKIRDASRSGTLDGLAKANALLESEVSGLAASELKLRLLPEYYRKLADGLADDRAQATRQASELLSQLTRLRDTLKNLQDYARDGGDMQLREAVEIPTVLDAALKLQESRIFRDRIEVRKDVGAVPPIVSQRAKVVHVLVTVIDNAIDAMERTPRDQRVLGIRVRESAGGGIQVQISDTGDGIAPEHRERIFSYGFTTKPSGHGFGLHTCANYMSQMGGSIQAESAGPGRGATITLVFSWSS